jgi:hypothetical protein
MMIDAGGEAGSANINGTQGGDPEECGGFWSFLKKTLLDACRGSVLEKVTLLDACRGSVVERVTLRARCHVECTSHFKVCNADALIQGPPLHL